jgi:hypothetical protein
VSQVVYVVLAVIGIAGMIALFRNYHKQREFEGSDHVVPEEYD